MPVHDDRKLYEFLVLDAFQAGLSWRTVLHKRQAFKKAFANFSYRQVALFTARDVRRLMGDASIIRNRQKIQSAIVNAKSLMGVQKEFGSFEKYLWSFVGDRPVMNRWNSSQEIPATSPPSDAMSQDMKKRNFSFCGSTICYACMQAAGLVNDHLQSCFRYRMVQRGNKK